MSLKSRREMNFEAEMRRQDIARKTKKLGVTRCGNVPSSFGRNNKEFLLNMGFYEKNTNNAPSKTAWCEKRLNPEVMEIEVRKQGK